MADYYILKGHTAVAADRALWGRWYETARAARVVKQEALPSGMWVSTVFLGLNHAWREGAPPAIFETMVFQSEADLRELDCERCSTWEQAEAQHAALVAKWSQLPADVEA